jgi:glucose/arabinose dehydrogenase
LSSASILQASSLPDAARFVEPRTATGYKVVRVLFTNGKPTGEYDDFMTGFVVSDKQVWGRPVGVAVAKDGSLL